MREVSRHLFIPRRPLIASMLSSDPEKSWIWIVKVELSLNLGDGEAGQAGSGLSFRLDDLNSVGESYTENYFSATGCGHRGDASFSRRPRPQLVRSWRARSCLERHPLERNCSRVADRRE